MAKLNISKYTHPLIDFADASGWGTTGAAIGAAAGMGVGMISDNTGVIGGAFMGAAAGALGGRLARFGSGFKGVRTDEQMTRKGLLDAGDFGGFGNRWKGGKVENAWGL